MTDPRSNFHSKHSRKPTEQTENIRPYSHSFLEFPIRFSSVASKFPMSQTRKLVMTTLRKSQNKKSLEEKPDNFSNESSEVLPISQEVLFQYIQEEIAKQALSTPSSIIDYNDCDQCSLTTCQTCPCFLEYDTPEHLDMNIGIFITTYWRGGMP